MEVKVDVKNKKKIEHNLIQYKYLGVFYIFCLPEKICQQTKAQKRNPFLLFSIHKGWEDIKVNPAYQ